MRNPLLTSSRRHHRLMPLAAAVTLCFFGNSNAATISVNNPGENSVAGSCTLADAVRALNTATAVNGCAAGNGSNDTIDLSFFATPQQISFTLPTSADGKSALGISHPVTIRGLLGADGPNVSLTRSSISGVDFRIIATSADLVIQGVRIEKGFSNSRGAGIYASGTANLTVTDSVVSNNTIDANDPYGGGAIAIAHGSTTISHSTISGNTAAQFGGAVYTAFDGAIAVNESTISGNSAYNGGGIFSFSGNITINNSTISGNSGSDRSRYAGGAIYGNADMTLTNSTITGNSSCYGAAVSAYHRIKVYFSTIAGNTRFPAANCYGGGLQVSADGSLVSIGSIFTNNAGSNIVGYSIIFSGSNNIIGSPPNTAPVDTLDCDPLLMPLNDNGGPTPTMALLPGSCAIDAGPTVLPNGITKDQRQLARPAGTKSDVGAFEKQGANDPPELIFVNGFEGS